MGDTFKDSSDNSALYELESILHSLVANDTTILDALTQLLAILHETSARIEESHVKLNASIAGLITEVRSLTLDGSTVKNNHAGKTNSNSHVVISDDFAKNNPEIGLLGYLYSFLPYGTAVDVGAHVGTFSERLLEAGYTVYAFEPYPPSFALLQQRLQLNPRFRAFELAVGSSVGVMDLHLAADLAGLATRDASLYHSLVQRPMLPDLQFTKVQSVSVSTIEHLAHSGTLPRAIGLMKIDAEGYDLEVLRGLGDTDISVVMAEFWDPAHAFGASATIVLRDLVEEMKPRGFNWHIVVYHIDEDDTVSFYCNRTDTIRGSWGNVLFFRDRATFNRALLWCEETMSATLHR